MNRILPFLALLAIATLAAGPAFAEASGVVEVRPLVDTLTTSIVDFAVVVVTVLAGLAVKFLRDKTGIDIAKGEKEIEARYRDALHSAIYTGVATVITKTGVRDLSFNVGSEDLAAVIRHLRDSVPDALAYFLPSDTVIANIARAKAIELGAKIGQAAPAART